MSRIQGYLSNQPQSRVWALKLPKNALHVRASPRAVTAGTGRPSDANQHLDKCGYDAQRRRDARSSTRQLAHSLSLHGHLGQASLTTTPSTPPKRHNADTRLTPLIMRLRGYYCILTAEIGPDATNPDQGGVVTTPESGTGVDSDSRAESESDASVATAGMLLRGMSRDAKYQSRRSCGT